MNSYTLHTSLQKVIVNRNLKILSLKLTKSKMFPETSKAYLIRLSQTSKHSYFQKRFLVDLMFGNCRKKLSWMDDCPKNFHSSD